MNDLRGSVAALALLLSTVGVVACSSATEDAAWSGSDPAGSDAAIPTDTGVWNPDTGPKAEAGTGAPDGGNLPQPDATSQDGTAPAADCSSIAAHPGWQLCKSSPTSCEAVFTDSAGCAAVCASVGLACSGSYEDLSGQCAANTALPALACASTGHQSDYCICGPASSCTPQCSGKTCGDDSCGGSCGTCGQGLGCIAGQCAGADQPIGWASVSALGQDGTTGGFGGPTVTVNTLSALAAAVGGTASKVIRLSGHIKGDVDIGSNKTIEGEPGAVFEGHMQLDGVKNVILRNLKIVGYNCSDSADCKSGADVITVSQGTHHLWVDHCDISNGSDGNLDIVHGSDYVTVSWTRFSYSSSNREHRFSNLIGHADDTPEDEGHLKVTFHHDWWAGNVDQRQPRVRYGDVHVFNNYYSASGNSYCVAANFKSRVLVEGNYFKNVNDPITHDDTGNALESKNVFDGTSGDKLTTGKAFLPPYPYTLDKASDIPGIVQANAGPK